MPFALVIRRIDHQSSGIRKWRAHTSELFRFSLGRACGERNRVLMAVISSTVSIFLPWTRDASENGWMIESVCEPAFDYMPPSCG